MVTQAGAGASGQNPHSHDFERKIFTPAVCDTSIGKPRNLRSAAAVILRAADRREGRRPPRRGEPPHAARKPPQDGAKGSAKLPKEEFIGDGSARPMAQAGHAVAPIIGDPSGNETFRYAGGGGGIGGGPVVDNNALHDLSALSCGQGVGAGTRRNRLHAAPTHKHGENSPLFRLLRR